MASNDIISNIINDKQDIKNQLGTVPTVIPSVKRFINAFQPKRHSTILNKATVGFGSFILNNSSYGVLGTDKLGRGGHTDETWAVIPNNNIFDEHFFDEGYINTTNSTGTLGVDSYILNTEEVLESTIIAKLRQPITSVYLYDNSSFIDGGGGMTLPFTLGESTFSDNSIRLYFSNDSGSNWVEANENETLTFPTSSINDELKYKIIANTEVTISNPIKIKVN